MGMPGSPLNASCVRQFDTDGYGCDVGGANWRFITLTGKSLA